MLFWEKLFKTLTALLNLITSINNFHSTKKNTKNSTANEEFSAQKDV
ncbi:hypothetical protein NE686_01290 [Tissierella carlieri]|uniref:Uncharacterized protein n=1 Tax=Tissierella carlieri TaxID=689904 RepID=A0ABT1S5R8_9FIRM|nr:hypothetical protein [Tissierella carlieri]MCQ4921705.1 hypothetical protein [Tissierella carlieri]